MKKHLTAAIAAMLVLGFAASVTFARNGNPRGSKGPRDPRARERQRPEGELRQFIKELDLTAEKEAQVEQIFKTHRQAVANWASENADDVKELRERIAEAREAGENEKAKAAREKLRKLFQSRAQLRKDLLEQLGEVLTDEQMKKVKTRFRPRVLARHRILAAIRRLDLTEEQKAQIKEILDAARAEAKEAEGPKAKIFEAAFKKIRTEVLTDEQRKKLAQMRKHFRPGQGPFAGLDLTDEQRQEIRAIMEKARKKIHDEVLTDEQREKLKRRRKGPWRAED